MEYVVIITKDEESNVWIAKNTELPIVLKDESLDNLMKRSKKVAAVMAEMNNLPKPIVLYFTIQAIIKEKIFG